MTDTFEIVVPFTDGHTVVKHEKERLTITVLGQIQEDGSLTHPIRINGVPYVLAAVRKAYMVVDETKLSDEQEVLDDEARVFFLLPQRKGVRLPESVLAVGEEVKED